MVKGSFLGPPLYILYTTDMPLIHVDDTVIIAVHKDSQKTSDQLQNSLNNIQKWFKNWRIRENIEKSTHITFTLRNSACPAVLLNSKTISAADFIK